MSRFSILVVSAGSTTASWLADRLDRREYSVTAARPGHGLIQAARQTRPHLAVLDGINARPQSASLEVALLKDQCPDVQIIALSGESSELDGDVIEQGVFCYLAGCSFDELLRVIEAAAQERQQTADTIVFTPIQPRSVT